MRIAASAVACLVAAISVMSAIVLAGSLMRDVTGVRLGLPGFPDDRAAAPLSADVVRRLDALVAAFPGSAGVWIADPLSRAPLYAHDADASMITASLYKLGVLMEAERRVENRELRYSDAITIGFDDVTEEGSAYEPGAVVSLDDALEAMITASDNGTALALWHLFGGSTIDETLARAGMRAFHVTMDPSGNTLATPHSVGTYFALLARRELVSIAASERMLSRLERQTLNDRLPSALPARTVVAHKTGNLPGVIHDAGIIFTPAGPRIVVVMTTDADEGANAFIAEVAAIVYAASLEPAARQ